MRNITLLLLPIFALLMVACTSQTSTIEKIEKTEKYEANWESLAKHKRIPEWFSDSKFGIYFHWGVYSVPAYKTEWYPYHLYKTERPDFKAYHENTFGPLSEFNYHDFIPHFKAENFDPEEWADLFKEAGVKFAGPVAQHHDGFAMWDSEVNPWNSADMGPKRDITGEILSALKKRNIKTLATFHHARLRQRHEGDSTKWQTYNSHYAYNPKYITSTTDPNLAKFYGNMPQKEFDQYWLDQVNEVVDKYSPDMIWYDTWLNFIDEKKIQEMTTHHFNKGLENDKEVVVIYKQNDMPKNIGILDIEQGGKKDLSADAWMTDVTISDKGSWCYTEGQKYKSTSMVLRNMIDVWSKNGVVLLNISPDASGTINTEQRNVLGGIGSWMKTYGEAVYGTKPYYIYGFGNAAASEGGHGGQSAKVKYSASDVRFTWSKDEKSLYVFLLGKPKAGSVINLKKISAVSYAPKTPIKSVVEMSTQTPVEWEITDRGTLLTIPDIEYNELANVFKFELE